jgi:hypothetical protein
MFELQKNAYGVKFNKNYNDEYTRCKDMLLKFSSIDNTYIKCVVQIILIRFDALICLRWSSKPNEDPFDSFDQLEKKLSNGDCHEVCEWLRELETCKSGLINMSNVLSNDV